MDQWFVTMEVFVALCPGVAAALLQDTLEFILRYPTSLTGLRPTRNKNNELDAFDSKHLKIKIRQTNTNSKFEHQAVLSRKGTLS